MMQLWEGNSKENVLQVDIKNNLQGKITILAKTEILKVSLHNSTIIENQRMDFSNIGD